RSGGWPNGLTDELTTHLASLEKRMGRNLGDAADPLLVSVRSGAEFSMPGMMDTVLNLGLNDKSVEGLAKQTNNERFALDSYRRFIQMFGRIVLGIDGEHFDAPIEAEKKKAGVQSDAALTVDALSGLVQQYKAIIEKETGKAFPQDPAEQLRRAIEAVFSSW